MYILDLKSTFNNMEYDKLHAYPRMFVLTKVLLMYLDIK